MNNRISHPDDLNAHGDVDGAPADIITRTTKPAKDPARTEIAKIDTPDVQARIWQYFQQK